MALYIGDKRYAITKALYRGFYMVVVHGFAGTTVTCAGTTLYIGSNESVIFKIVDPGTYTFIATRKGETKTETLVLDPKTSQYSYNIGMYIGIQKIEYLQGSNTQYIDTGVFPKGSHTKVVVETLASTNDDQNGKTIFGSRDEYGVNAFCCSFFNEQNERNLRCQYGSDTSYNINASSSILNKKVTYVLDKNVFTVYDENGTTIGTYSRALEDFTGASSMFLFGWNNAQEGSLDGELRNSGLRIYSCKIYEDNELIHDFIPVLDNTQTGCMYDLVSQQMYYNAGEGNFIAGPSMAYDELVYIESTGTQWIDTEIIPNETTDIEIIINKNTTMTGVGNGIFGNDNVGARWDTLNGFRGGFGTQSWTTTTVTQSDINIISFNKTNPTFNSTSLSVSRGTGYGSENLYIFRNSGSYSSIKVYGMKIYNNNVLVRDMIPVKRKNGDICMWDKVEEKFYYNKGTGNFIAGPKLEYTELEYIQSSGTQYIDTGVRVDDTYGFSIVSEKNEEFISEDQVVIGVKGSDESRWVYNPANIVYLSWNTAISTSISPSGLHTVSMNYLNNRKRLIDGISVGDITQTLSTNASEYTVCLFGVKWGSETIANPFKGKVYNVKISSGSNILYDFIPVKRSDNVVGMLDKVNNKFYWNLGTGEFTGGGVVDHTELEWIQSNTDGEQYIDTGIVPNANQQIDITYQKEDDEYVMVFGSRQAWDSSMSTLSNVSVSDDVTRIVWGNSELYVTTPFITDKVTFSISDGSILKDGVRVSTSSYGSSYYNGPMYLFSVNNGGTPMSGQYCRNTKIYSFSVYNNGNLIQDLVPVKRNTDNVVCLFDRVTRTYFENAGTGEFIAGPVKSN